MSLRLSFFHCNTNRHKSLFSELSKAILSLLIACIKGKIKANMGISILSDLVSVLFLLIVEIV